MLLGYISGIDTFIHSSLSYIILDVIMKATMDDFQKYDIPFQTKGKQAFGDSKYDMKEDVSHQICNEVAYRYNR